MPFVEASGQVQQSNFIGLLKTDKETVLAIYTVLYLCLFDLPWAFCAADLGVVRSGLHSRCHPCDFAPGVKIFIPHKSAHQSKLGASPRHNKRKRPANSY